VTKDTTNDTTKENKLKMEEKIYNGK